MTESLPELPKGYFWRITEIYIFSTPLVQIRKKRWIGSEELLSTRIGEPYEGKSWEDMALYAARHLYRKFQESERYAIFVSKVEGDYPPKSTKDW